MKFLILSKETNCSLISRPSDVENSSVHINIHYDKNTQQFMLIPFDSSKLDKTSHSNKEASEHSKLHVSSSPNESFGSSKVRQPLLTRSNTSSHLEDLLLYLGLHLLH
ncbi:PREDICTED: uncharacterized protein LOC108748541 [Trachymyrmex septentrionalis]|uniref:uncharacterized protein LOC108748541 n=1 Tax=Trachymyrmex septentrionalis TaxID=34720 RepID=UPI00084ED45D|nr:PREDICTED: uncharacterized protein LOC108748541 [Trachymyrmex septentrionalis]